jgi:hypothetical protein
MAQGRHHRVISQIKSLVLTAKILLFDFRPVYKVKCPGYQNANSDVGTKVTALVVVVLHPCHSLKPPLVLRVSKQAFV